MLGLSHLGFTCTFFLWAHDQSIWILFVFGLISGMDPRWHRWPPFLGFGAPWKFTPDYFTTSRSGEMSKCPPAHGRLQIEPLRDLTIDHNDRGPSNAVRCLRGSFCLSITFPGWWSVSHMKRNSSRTIWRLVEWVGSSKNRCYEPTGRHMSFTKIPWLLIGCTIWLTRMSNFSLAMRGDMFYSFNCRFNRFNPQGRWDDLWRSAKRNSLSVSGNGNALQIVLKNGELVLGKLEKATGWIDWVRLSEHKRLGPTNHTRNHLSWILLNLGWSLWFESSS